MRSPNSNYVRVLQMSDEETRGETPDSSGTPDGTQTSDSGAGAGSAAGTLSQQLHESATARCVIFSPGKNAKAKRAKPDTNASVETRVTTWHTDTPRGGSSAWWKEIKGCYTASGWTAWGVCQLCVDAEAWEDAEVGMSMPQRPQNIAAHYLSCHGPKRGGQHGVILARINDEARKNVPRVDASVATTRRQRTFRAWRRRWQQAATSLWERSGEGAGGGNPGSGGVDGRTGAGRAGRREGAKSGSSSAAAADHRAAGGADS